MAERRLVYLGVVLILVVVIVAAVFSIPPSPGKSSSNSTSTSRDTTPVCTTPPKNANATNSRVQARGVVAANYVEQLWKAFSQNSSALSYNVTATAQNDTFGYGPSYVLNGLTDKGLWYQVGLSYNQVTTSSSGFSHGFRISYEVWDSSTNKSIFPSYGTAGSLYFNLTKAGDAVRLSLTFNNGSVIMEGYDWRLGITASVTYPALGASKFVGFFDKVPHYPSSLLTEWQHALPYFCSDQKVVFWNKQAQVTTAWLRVDEWNLTGVPSSYRFSISSGNDIVFNTAFRQFNFGNSSALKSLGSNGTEIYSNSTAFVTM